MPYPKACFCFANYARPKGERYFLRRPLYRENGGVSRGELIALAEEMGSNRAV